MRYGPLLGFQLSFSKYLTSRHVLRSSASLHALLVHVVLYGQAQTTTFHCNNTIEMVFYLMNNNS